MELEKEVIKEKPDYLRIIFLVILIIAIGALIYTTITIVKYKDILVNPMGVSMNQFGLKYCTCYDSQWRIVSIEGISYNDSFSKFVPKPEYDYDSNSIIQLNLTFIP